MQDVLEYILKNITTTPDDVQVTSTDDAGVTNYTISVHPDDVGRIIGKEGKVIKAIRTIMRVIAIQQGVRVRVSVLSGDEDKDVVTVEEAPVPEVEPTIEDTSEVQVEEATQEVSPDSLSVEL